MDIQVLVNSIDKTDFIDWTTFSKEDVLNSQTDSLTFTTKKHGSITWKPAAGDEIVVMDGADKIFGGVVVQVDESIAGLTLEYQVTCKDWTQYLDRVFVVENFQSQTIDQIIDYINTNYLTGFTIENVSCDILVQSISFNRLPVSKCLQLLAEQVNYNWYVDYDKDIHFFAKNSEAAPFSLDDTSGNYIFNSLRITDDISQMRNRVFVRGGEMIGNSLTENYVADGSQKTFPLGHKFSSEPTVTVGGVSQNVGIEFVNKDEDFDCLWDYNQKSLRFVNAPSASAAVAITGTPKIPILVQVQDDNSISQYGAYEYAITDQTILSKEEAKQYAIAQLDAYAQQIQEGEFSTYRGGLRSGQVITIQSDIREISESFLIQKVSLQMIGYNKGQYEVGIATLRTMGIIDFLQKLLLSQNKQIVVSSDAVLEKYYRDSQQISVTEEISLHTNMQDHQDVAVTEKIRANPWPAGVEFVLAPYVPTDDTIIKEREY